MTTGNKGLKIFIKRNNRDPEWWLSQESTYKANMRTQGRSLQKLATEACVYNSSAGEVEAGRSWASLVCLVSSRSMGATITKITILGDLKNNTIQLYACTHIHIHTWTRATKTRKINCEGYDHTEIINVWGNICLTWFKHYTIYTCVKTLHGVSLIYTIYMYPIKSKFIYNNKFSWVCLRQTHFTSSLLLPKALKMHLSTRTGF